LVSVLGQGRAGQGRDRIEYGQLPSFPMPSKIWMSSERCLSTIGNGRGKQLPVMLSKLPLDNPGRAFGYTWVYKKKRAAQNGSLK